MTKRKAGLSGSRTVKQRSGEVSIGAEIVIPFDGFPDEIQMLILQFTDPIRDKSAWLAGQLVCKKWKGILQQIANVVHATFVDTRDARILSALEFIRMTGFSPLCHISIILECGEHRIPFIIDIDKDIVGYWTDAPLSVRCRKGHGRSAWKEIIQDWEEKEICGQTSLISTNTFLEMVRPLLQEIEGDLKGLFFEMKANPQFEFSVPEQGQHIEKYMECIQYPRFCCRDGRSLIFDMDTAKEMEIDTDAYCHFWFEEHRIKVSLSDLGKVQVPVKIFQRFMWE